MADKLAFLRNNGRGQVLAELCLVMPFTILLVMGVLQLLLAGYGAGFARFAAFCALRSAAVSPPLERQAVAFSSAVAALAGVPGVGVVWVTVARIPVPPGYGVDCAAERLACKVRVKVPRVAPFMGPCIAEGGCAMKMESSR